MYRFHVYANYTKYLDYLVFFSPLKRSNKSEKQKVLRGMRESADPSSALSRPHFSTFFSHNKRLFPFSFSPPST